MALRAVPDHPKFTELKVRLRLPRYAVLGCLEALWHFTGRFTPQGNIGKYSDQAIEDWVGWEGKSGELISALVETHWIDPDRTHRLLIHDWHQHADKATKNALNRAKLGFFCTNAASQDSTVYVQSTDDIRTPPVGIGVVGGTPSANSMNLNVYVQSTDVVPPVSRLPEPVPVPVPGAGPVRPNAPPIANASPPIAAPFDWPEIKPDPPNGAQVNPMGSDAGAEMELATWFFQELGIPADFNTREMACQAIRGLVKKGAPNAKEAADYLLEQARKAPDTINRFWFQDQKYMKKRSPLARAN